VDNLCHSLAGAVIAQAGFARRVPRATLLCVIGANIPDVDASAYLWGDSLTALTFRRGWTHGLPALVVWSVLLAAVFWWWRRPGHPDTTRRTSNAFRWTLAAATLSVFSHTSLDWLNNYGVRWLMPFSERWFYGDALFIVDLVLLVLFGAGWWFSRRRLRSGSAVAERPARVAIVLALVYIAAMKGMSEASRATIVTAAGVPAAESGPDRVMVSPGPAAFLKRQALVRTDSSYDWYEVRVGASAASLRPFTRVPPGDTSPAARRVRQTAEWAQYSRWTRFPYFVVAPDGDSSMVFIGDVRYATGTTDSFATLRVRLEK